VADGNFYGTGSDGGADGWGTVFRITPDGALTLLHTFTGYPTEGALPYAGLLQATSGDFYGTTYAGGANGPDGIGGTVFKITPPGVLTTIYSFCAQPNCADGSYPIAGLIENGDGNLYGATNAGGASLSAGTIFRITLQGSLTTMYDFCAQPSCASEPDSPSTKPGAWSRTARKIGESPRSG
jgi:uncharacterized repeat protein (TIGR03803 family)